MTLYILLPKDRLRNFLLSSLHDHIVLEIISLEDIAPPNPKLFIPEILENEVRKLTHYYYPAEEKTWIDETKKTTLARNLQKCTRPRHRHVYKRERRS